MDAALAKSVELNGYDAIVRDGPALAIKVVSDFIDIFKTTISSETSAASERELDEACFKQDFLNDLEKLRDALDSNAELQPGQQRLLINHLHYCSENMDIGLGDYREIMVVVTFVHGCARASSGT